MDSKDYEDAIACIETLSGILARNFLKDNINSNWFDFLRQIHQKIVLSEEVESSYKDYVKEIILEEAESFKKWIAITQEDTDQCSLVISFIDKMLRRVTDFSSVEDFLTHLRSLVICLNVSDERSNILVELNHRLTGKDETK